MVHRTGAFGREVSTARLRSLEHPALSIADDAPTPSETVRANPLGTKKGYNPYDSGKLGKPAAPPRKKDLRRLSEFLKLKNKRPQQGRRRVAARLERTVAHGYRRTPTNRPSPRGSRQRVTQFCRASQTIEFP